MVSGVLCSMGRCIIMHKQEIRSYTNSSSTTTRSVLLSIMKPAHIMIHLLPYLTTFWPPPSAKHCPRHLHKRIWPSDPCRQNWDFILCYGLSCHWWWSLVNARAIRCSLKSWGTWAGLLDHILSFHNGLYIVWTCTHTPEAHLRSFPRSLAVLKGQYSVDICTDLSCWIVVFHLQPCPQHLT